MSDSSEISYDFKISIFPEYVRRVTASAIISAQYVEKVFKYICLLINPNSFKFTLEDIMSGDNAKTRQTLGMINRKLCNSTMLDSSFSERFSEYIQRRNRVVHGLFAETFSSKSDIHFESPKAQKYVAECEWVAEEGAQLVEVGFGIFRALGEIFKPYTLENQQYDEILRSFDEFHELGNGYIASDLEFFMGQYMGHKNPHK